MKILSGSRRRAVRLWIALALTGVGALAAIGVTPGADFEAQAAQGTAAIGPAKSDAEPAGHLVSTSVSRSLAPKRTAAGSTAPSCRKGQRPANAPFAYGWPVKPFHRQHPVRGHFGDPRIGPGSDGTIHRTLHFGIDVSAPDGTAVYATASGVAAANALHPDVVRILLGNGVELSYWHISPRVRPGQRVVAYRTVIGRIDPGWGHVHFSELRNGVFVNPLRRGAMGPYLDETCPSIVQVRFERDGSRMRARSLRGGGIDVVARALDAPAVSAPAPWKDLPVTPATVEWRIVTDHGRVVQRWRTAFDVSRSLPSGSFETVYATRTQQNRPRRPGVYRFCLARDWDASTLRNGAYVLEVQLTDTGGNRSVSRWPFTIGT